MDPTSPRGLRTPSKLGPRPAYESLRFGEPKPSGSSEPCTVPGPTPTTGEPAAGRGPRSPLHSPSKLAVRAGHVGAAPRSEVREGLVPGELASYRRAGDAMPPWSSMIS